MNNASIQPEVISLLRFSTPGQVSDEKAGAKAQRMVNEATALRYDVRIRREVLLVDVSGRHVLLNEQFIQTLEEMKNDSTISGILVPEQSRIFRPDPDHLETYGILSRFKKYKKLIYAPDGILDMNKQGDRMGAMVKGIMAGEEIEVMKDRFARGKASDRLERKHPGGNHMLPKVVRYVRDRQVNENGKMVTVGTRWEPVPLEVERMRKAIELLFEGLPFEVIVEMVGGYGSGNALKRAMQNPILIGIRRYDSQATGEEEAPESRPSTYAKHEPGWQPKPRKRLVKRETPLDVPTRRQLELWYAGDKVNGQPPIVEPVCSLEVFDRLQQIIAERYNEHRKTKVKNQDRPRFLATGTAICTCGQPLYPNYGSKGRSHLDVYICKSRFNGGPGCGMHSIRRTDGDAAIETLVSRLADITFLLATLDAAIALQEAAPSPARVEYENALAKKKQGMKNLVDALGDGDITREQFREKKASLEAEVRALETLLPPPASKIDPKDVADLIVRAFKEFAFLAFADKRALLQGAVKSIIVDGHARTLVGVTVNGGFLGAGANSSLRSTAPLAICAVPDVVVRFPQPIEIPEIVAEQMAVRREDKKAATAARQPEIRVARLARRRVNESKAGASPEVYAKKLSTTAAWKREQRAKLRDENPEAYAAFKAKKAAEQRAGRVRRAAKKAA
jgi:hypothetical protein